MDPTPRARKKGVVAIGKRRRRILPLLPRSAPIRSGRSVINPLALWHMEIDELRSKVELAFVFKVPELRAKYEQNVRWPIWGT